MQVKDIAAQVEAVEAKIAGRQPKWLDADGHRTSKMNEWWYAFKRRNNLKCIASRLHASNRALAEEGARSIIDAVNELTRLGIPSDRWYNMDETMIQYQMGRRSLAVTSKKLKGEF